MLSPQIGIQSWSSPSGRQYTYGFNVCEFMRLPPSPFSQPPHVQEINSFKIVVEGGNISYPVELTGSGGFPDVLAYVL